MAKTFKIGSPRFLTHLGDKQPGAVPRSWLVVSQPPPPAAEADRLVLDLTNQPDLNAFSLSAEAAGGIERAALLPAASSPELEAMASVAVSAGCASVILSCAASGADVQRLDVLLRVVEAVAGTASLRIVALLDERGLLAAQSFQNCSTRLVALGLQTCSPHDPTSDVARLSRAQLVLAARSANLHAIDTRSEQTDMESFRLECMDARRNGFDGKFTALPQQVAIINSVFAAGA
jgi:citrate lyase subunit beta/citryl-CoA lyase